MSPLDLAGLRAAAQVKAASVDTPGPCNRRCRDRGECAFGRSEVPGSYCRGRPERPRAAAPRGAGAGPGGEGRAGCPPGRS
jgi:hypothetical protein